METLLDWFEISVPLWIAVLVGILFGSVFGQIIPSVRCFGFVRHRLLPRGQQNELETQERVATAASEKSNGATLAASTIQIDDLLAFYRKLHYKDCGPPWEFLTERSIPGMTYQAWRRDPQEGPTEYRTRHIFANVTPEIIRDFFWDDELRHEWDSLIRSAKCVEGCFETGENITHWVKKFPLFCSDREYVIRRRIYECEGAFFCIMKAASHENIPVKRKPRRVPVFSCSWCIQAVESLETGQMTSCEVTFLFSEDLLIQRDLAKAGAKRLMWPLVKRMEPGLRKYQTFRKTTSTLSLSASLAQVCTSIRPSLFEESDTIVVSGQIPGKDEIIKQGHANACKWVVIGGVLVLACGFGRGPVGRILVLGLAKGFGRFQRRQSFS
ncbi:hypothetical protein L7F22_034199 [Adiantum nelumboides]|nr:hypothetical protein [Adiantum nelumboides]